MNEVILPIGTVCTLKGANKKIMITAFFIAEDSNPNELYDYCGCLWPEGMVDSENHFLFNKDKIDIIHHIGFTNEEEKEFKNKLNEIIKSKFNGIEDELEQSVQKTNIINDPNDLTNSNIGVTSRTENSQQNLFNTLNLNQQDIDNN